MKRKGRRCWREEEDERREGRREVEEKEEVRVRKVGIGKSRKEGRGKRIMEGR